MCVSYLKPDLFMLFLNTLNCVQKVDLSIACLQVNEPFFVWSDAAFPRQQHDQTEHNIGMDTETIF